MTDKKCHIVEWSGPEWLRRVAYPSRARHHLLAILRAIPSVLDAIATQEQEDRPAASAIATELRIIQSLLGVKPQEHAIDRQQAEEIVSRARVRRFPRRRGEVNGIA